MIDAFLRALESVFAWLIEASWQASVLVALVLLLHRTLRGRLNPRWHHAMWLLVIARLMLPFPPESALSLFQFAPPPPSIVTKTVTEPLFQAPAAPMAGITPVPAPPVAYPFSIFTVLALIWLTGVVAFLVLTWQVNRRFTRHVAKAPSVTDPRLLGLAATARQELGVHRRLRIIESAQVQSPAIMGLFRPMLILPKDVRARFADAELRLIFLHEFAHLKRGDLVLQWLVALLQILHWFNPMLWYAFRRMRADREPATDALVLSCTGEADKESYGQVLVKLLEHYHQRHSLPTLVGILEDKDQFKRRFSLIARFTHGAYSWSLLGVLIIGILSVAGLTKSKATATPAVEDANKQLLAASQKGDVATAVSASMPITDATGTNPVVMIRIAPKVVQINEDEYQAHRADIDKAVQKGDVTPLSNLRSYSLLSSPAVLTKSGEQGVLEAVRVIPYPVAFGKDADGNYKPNDFKRQDVGVRFVVFPTFVDGKIKFKGDLSITSLDKYTQTEDNPHQPVFHVRELPVSALFVSGETKGFEVPGGAQMERANPALCFLPDKIANASQNPKALRRIFLFLNAQAFHQDGRPMTAQADAAGPAAHPTPPSNASKDLDTLKKDLLVTKEDADARRVLVDSVKNLPDDQFLATLAGLGRSDANITALQKEIADKKADIAGLFKSGYTEDHPRIQSVRAELASLQQKLKRLTDGLHSAMNIDDQMADSRVALLQEEVDKLKTQTLPP